MTAVFRILTILHHRWWCAYSRVLLKILSELRWTTTKMWGGWETSTRVNKFTCTTSQQRIFVSQKYRTKKLSLSPFLLESTAKHLFPKKKRRQHVRWAQDEATRWLRRRCNLINRLKISFFLFFRPLLVLLFHFFDRKTPSASHNTIPTAIITQYCSTSQWIGMKSFSSSFSMVSGARLANSFFGQLFPPIMSQFKLFKFEFQL